MSITSSRVLGEFLYSTGSFAARGLVAPVFLSTSGSPNEATPAEAAEPPQPAQVPEEGGEPKLPSSQHGITYLRDPRNGKEYAVDIPRASDIFSWTNILQLLAKHGFIHVASTTHMYLEEVRQLDEEATANGEAFEDWPAFPCSRLWDVSRFGPSLCIELATRTLRSMILQTVEALGYVRALSKLTKDISKSAQRKWKRGGLPGIKLPLGLALTAYRAMLATYVAQAIAASTADILRLIISGKEPSLLRQDNELVWGRHAYRGPSDIVVRSQLVLFLLLQNAARAAVGNMFTSMVVGCVGAMGLTQYTFVSFALAEWLTQAFVMDPAVHNIANGGTLTAEEIGIFMFCLAFGRKACRGLAYPPDSNRNRMLFRVGASSTSITEL